MRQPAALLALSFALAGCPAVGYETELGDCPDGSSITWADASAAFDANCNRCHDSALTTSSERFSAPLGWDYDTAELARRDADESWTRIYTGNMPPDADMSDEDKAVIWEWYSCDAPD